MCALMPSRRSWVTRAEPRLAVSNAVFQALATLLPRSYASCASQVQVRE